ncbi:MAG: hypothetical protein J2P28_03825 [Actinobacteria bacterium]|nr:hypothetical protein [Actinomycetota bacterium]
MPWKKITLWTLGIFAVYYLLTEPHSAGIFMQHVLSGLRSVGQSLSQFLSNL